MTKVYIASKMHHAERWRKLYSEDTIHLVSRWPFLEPCVEPTPRNARCFWQDDFTDLQSCDVLIFYAEEGEKLRGALVEVGIALGLGKTVITAGDHPDLGTWCYHPLVIQANNFNNALAIAKGFKLRG